MPLHDKHYFNTDDLVPIHTRKAKIIKDIEEAEWMEVDPSELKCELETIKRDIGGGALYYPMF